MATYHVHVYTTVVTRVLTSCFWRKNERRTVGAYVEDRRNNRRLATFTCTLCVVQIRFSRFGGCLSPTAPTDPPRDQEKPKTKSDTPSQQEKPKTKSDTPSQTGSPFSSGERAWPKLLQTCYNH